MAATEIFFEHDQWGRNLAWSAGLHTAVVAVIVFWAVVLPGSHGGDWGAGGGGGASRSQVTALEPVVLVAAEFIVRNRSTRCPNPGLSKIVSLFRIIVTPAAAIPTAIRKITRRIISPSKRRRIGTKMNKPRTTTAATSTGVVIIYAIPGAMPTGCMASKQVGRG